MICVCSELEWDKYKQGIVKELVRANVKARGIRKGGKTPALSEVPVSVRTAQLRPITNRGYHDMKIKQTDNSALEPLSKRMQIEPVNTRHPQIA